MLGKLAQTSPSQKARVVLNRMGKDHSGSNSTNDFIFKEIYSPEGILIMNEGVEMLNFMCITHPAIDTPYSMKCGEINRSLNSK